MFVNQKTARKYQCMHCGRVAKNFFRCKCSTPDKEEKDKAKNEDKGLSCSDCMSKCCTKCGKNDQYTSDGKTNGKIRKLTVHCSNRKRGCDKKCLVKDLDDHLRKCVVPCQYSRIGCTTKAAGKEIEEHEQKVNEHFALAMKVVCDLHSDNTDMKQRITTLETTVSTLQSQVLKQPSPT